MTEVYLLFNKLLQRKEPLIIKLFDSQQRFMPKFAFRFIKPNVIRIQEIHFYLFPWIFKINEETLN